MYSTIKTMGSIWYNLDVYKCGTGWSRSSTGCKLQRPPWRPATMTPGDLFPSQAEKHETMVSGRVPCRTSLRVDGEIPNKNWGFWKEKHQNLRCSSHGWFFGPGLGNMEWCSYNTHFEGEIGDSTQYGMLSNISISDRPPQIPYRTTVSGCKQILSPLKIVWSILTLKQW